VLCQLVRRPSVEAGGNSSEQDKTFYCPLRKCLLIEVATGKCPSLRVCVLADSFEVATGKFHSLRVSVLAGSLDVGTGKFHSLWVSVLVDMLAVQVYRGLRAHVLPFP
jgi:hypothetical protein